MEYDQKAAHKKRQLDLKRPLAFIDVETTGLSTLSDRIVEIGVLKIMPDGRKSQFYAKLNPECPISKAAVRVHGITNEEVENKPTFKMIASRLLQLLGECDLAGFNVAKFDLPFLREEFRRVAVSQVYVMLLHPASEASYRVRSRWLPDRVSSPFQGWRLCVACQKSATSGG